MDRVSFAGLWETIEEINSCKPEVKASKLDKRMPSYGHSKICMVSAPCWAYMDAFDIENRRRGHLLIATRTPTRKFFDNPAFDLLTEFGHILKVGQDLNKD